METQCTIETVVRNKAVTCFATLLYRRKEWVKSHSVSVTLTDEETKMLYALYERIEKEYPPNP